MCFHSLNRLDLLLNKNGISIYNKNDKIVSNIFKQIKIE